ncbi:MAG: GtrA family protein [Patescibacteria group bacterium]|nr:GtrA family protein [Patescibacteria group bacterium]
MIKKTFAYFWSLRHQFVKYFIVGISAVVIDMSSLIFLKEALGIAPVFAVIANQAVVLIFVFLANKYWSFKGTALSRGQIIRFAIVVTFDYFFAVAAMYVFNHRLNFDYRLVRLGSIALAVSWNFFLYKYWVYAVEAEIAPPPEN